jgi:hypothetical protein
MPAAQNMASSILEKRKRHTGSFKDLPGETLAVGKF